VNLQGSWESSYLGDLKAASAKIDNEVKKSKKDVFYSGRR
jgi:hypothetical protein